jgi:hypothetical protein
VLAAGTDTWVQPADWDADEAGVAELAQTEAVGRVPPVRSGKELKRVEYFRLIWELDLGSLGLRRLQFTTALVAGLVS